MKTLTKNLTWFGLFIFLLGGHALSQAQNNAITITGVLKDAKTGDKISYATISVPNTSIGTVSNSEGEFILKVNPSLKAEYFQVSHLSYTTTQFKINEANGKEKTYYLDLQPVTLKELAIPADPRSVVEMALAGIRQNYSDKAAMMTGFSPFPKRL